MQCNNRTITIVAKNKIFIVAVLSFVFCETLFSQITVQNSGVNWAPMTVNNFSAWYATNGSLESTDPILKTVGATFPRKTSQAIFSSSFMFSANAPQPIVNGAYYSNNLQQGSILGIQTGIAENKFNAGNRIWRIRKDFMTADLRRDAADTYRISEKNISIMDMQRLRAEYKKDWMEWPVAKGAPYYDKNNNGVYDPKFTVNEFNVEIPDSASDSPGVAEADQVIWYVCNDLSGNSPWGTPAVGLEMQITIWGFNSSDALANVLFRRCRMVYKGISTTLSTDSLKNMYLGIWSEINLGQGNDNLAGSDSVLGLGYVYNSKLQDVEYVKFNTVPPAIGYDILQGPVVKGSSNDSAIVNFTFRKGWKNIPVSSITYTGQNNQPLVYGSQGLSQLSNALQGLPTRTNSLRIDPITQKPTKFWATGDPVSKQGWVDGVLEGAGSREVFISSGPFAMALGDTQEIVTAMIGAHSQDRLASVSVLKYYDKIAQKFFNEGLIPSPKLPQTSASATEFDRSVLIEWEKDTAVLNQTERFASQGFIFEGYNLFQLPSATSVRSEWKKFATYDLKNEIMQIVEEDVNLLTGRIELQVKQEGKNSGINRYVLLTYDSIRNRPLINGQEYYFALTSYAYTNNQNSLVRTIESEPQILTVIPHYANPETVVPYMIKDSLIDIGENIIGHNDGRIGLRILDPYSVIGGSYDIWYGISGSSSTWTMVKNLPGTDLATIKTQLTYGNLALPRPNPISSASGSASFTINDAMDKILFSVETNTATNVTSIELARGPKTQNGYLVKTLSTGSKNATGLWTRSDAIQPLTDSVIKDLAAGFLYVIVKSTAYPNGEMRGQLFDGTIPRVLLPIPDFATSARSVLSFQENRFPFEGFSLFVSPAPVGFKSGEQITPSRSNIVNESNKEGTYYLIGPGIAWGGYNLSESSIEIRFTNDINYAIVTAAIPAETKFIRVPFQIYQDSVRVWPVISNTINTDTAWDIKGNPFQNGKPTFDKIVGIVNKTDFVGNDISYNTTTAGGTFPVGNSLKGRLINGVNHIAKNIVFVNVSEDGKPPSSGTSIVLNPYKSIKYGDIKRISLRPLQKGNTISAKQQLSSINIYPNPYYGVNIHETSSTEKFVTISHLPAKATIKIFNLAGIHVRTLQKNDPGQFFRWDLRNEKGFFVASGLYVIYIEMENVGARTLKLAVIMEQLNLNTF